MRLDETMLVKQLLPEICHFIHTYREGNQHAAELRNSASGVLFSLSCNNFNAVFSRISTRCVNDFVRGLCTVAEHLQCVPGVRGSASTIPAKKDQVAGDGMFFD